MSVYQFCVMAARKPTYGPDFGKEEWRKKRAPWRCFEGGKKTVDVGEGFELLKEISEPMNVDSVHSLICSCAGSRWC